MNTVKQWLRGFWYKSWTTTLAQIKIIGGLFMAIGAYLGAVVNDPGVHASLALLNLPAEIGLGIAVLGALVLISQAHA